MNSQMFIQRETSLQESHRKKRDNFNKPRKKKQLIYMKQDVQGTYLWKGKKISYYIKRVEAM